MNIRLESSINPWSKMTQDKENQALKRACQEFESILVGQILSSMRSAVQKSDLFGSREKEELFQGLMDQEVAKQVCKTGRLGLAELIYDQLSGKKIAKVSVESVDKCLDETEIKDR